MACSTTPRPTLCSVCSWACEGARRERAPLRKREGARAHSPPTRVRVALGSAGRAWEKSGRRPLPGNPEQHPSSPVERGSNQRSDQGKGCGSAGRRERYMREAKIMQIFEGTNQIQRLVISRRLAD
ncbi:acyl-CoA dehydrogenase family protein [Streptomyces sp. NPDC000395]|uniref:acyl-CoA dehydrogenase family protein n=1 Tax=Streptomyces sp. NPDC000395 TaxID=3154252 RepID=UPI00336AC58E